MKRRLKTKRRPNRIAEIRQELRLSFEAVAKRIKKKKRTPGTIEKLEIGDMGLTFDWMYELGEALGRAAWEFIPGAPPNMSAKEMQILDLIRDPDRAPPAGSPGAERVVLAIAEAGQSAAEGGGKRSKRAVAPKKGQR